MPGVGNDVVDLKEPENYGKCRNERFLDRVLAEGEHRQIVSAGYPDTLLWSFWAAKEAAYKAVSRDDPTVCSIPRRYRVLLAGDTSSTAGDVTAGSEGLLTGRVITPRGDAALQIIVTGDYVHALVAESETALARLIHRVDRADAPDHGGDASTFVRLQLLREIARRLGCPVEDLAVRKDPSGSGAPRVLLRCQPLAAAISLSHDGRFAAFAFLFF